MLSVLCIPTAVIRQIFRQYSQWWSSFEFFRRFGGTYCFLFRVTVWVRWTLERLGGRIAFLMEEGLKDLWPYNQHSVSVPGHITNIASPSLAFKHLPEPKSDTLKILSICYVETMGHIKCNKHLQFDCYMNADCHQILIALHCFLFAWHRRQILRPFILAWSLNGLLQALP